MISQTIHIFLDVKSYRNITDTFILLLLNIHFFNYDSPMPFTISSILNSLALSQRDMILGYADSPIINVMKLCPWGTTGGRNCSLRPLSKWRLLYCAVSERQCRGFQVVKQLEWVSDLMRCVVNKSAFCLRVQIRTRRKRPDKNCSTWHNCLFSCAHVTQLRKWWKQLTRKWAVRGQYLQNWK